MEGKDQAPIGVDRYLTDILEHRMQHQTLRRILDMFPEGKRDALAGEVKALSKRLDSLIEATNRAREPQSLDAMLVRLVRLITEAFGADRSTLFLYDAETDELFSRVAQGDLYNELRFDANSGIAGTVFQSGETSIINDAYTDARFNQDIDMQTGYRTGSILCVPVRTRTGDIIGVSQVLNTRTGCFSDGDGALLRAFTTHMAAAIENMQLTERAEVSIREVSRLMEVTQAISSELDIDRLLRKIMSIATELLDAERSTLFLHDPRRNELWSRVAEGLDEREIRIAADSGIAGEAFTSRSVVNIPDAYDDARFNQTIDRATGFRTRSILCVPVISKHGIAIGVVQVLNRRGGPFTSRDQGRLEMLAAQSAIALDNARLFREVLDERNYSENVLRSLTNGVLTFDTHRNVVKTNEAAARILKRDATRILGENAANIFHDKNSWILDALVKVTQTRAPEASLDAEIITSIGETISVNLNFSPLSDSIGNLLGSTMVIEDITSEKRVRSTMARYMTREIADQVLEHGASVLGGSSQLATIAFTDIKDFTTIAERIGPQETVSLLNEYFTEMVEVVFAHNGILDKYIGDAIMAVFGAPFASPEDADNALHMAIEMQHTLQAFNRKRLAAIQPPIEIRIGISSDHIVAGNIGSDRRMDYTVIGDGVNLAARLESANKHFGTEILISETTLNLLHDRYHVREIDFIRVKGKKAPVPIFELIDHVSTPLPAKRARLLSAFAKGLDAYRKRDWLAAVRYFTSASEYAPEDVPSQLFLRRATNYADTPPADDWDGVWSL